MGSGSGTATVRFVGHMMPKGAILRPIVEATEKLLHIAVGIPQIEYSASINDQAKGTPHTKGVSVHQLTKDNKGLEISVQEKGVLRFVIIINVPNGFDAEVFRTALVQAAIVYNTAPEKIEKLRNKTRVLLRMFPTGKVVISEVKLPLFWEELGYNSHDSWRANMHTFAQRNPDLIVALGHGTYQITQKTLEENLELRIVASLSVEEKTAIAKLMPGGEGNCALLGFKDSADYDLLLSKLSKCGCFHDGRLNQTAFIDFVSAIIDQEKWEQRIYSGEKESVLLSTTPMPRDVKTGEEEMVVVDPTQPTTINARLEQIQFRLMMISDEFPAVNDSLFALEDSVRDHDERIDGLKEEIVRIESAREEVFGQVAKKRSELADLEEERNRITVEQRQLEDLLAEIKDKALAESVAKMIQDDLSPRARELLKSMLEQK